MKGRHTAFQRFGSGSHNPFGSVLNKYFLTSEVDRKNDIYEKTADGYKSNQPDLGEEVYGCIAKGINTQGHLEYDYEAMKAKRKTRGDVEQYDLGSKGTILRTWVDKYKKSYEDSSLVPQESIPLNVISKYPIKFSYDEYNTATEKNEVKEVDVPPSAGFSGPFLYRPSKFPSFTPTIVKEDCILRGSPASSVRIPSDVAHQMLNCTKEIKFTGNVDHSVEAKNKKCSGGSSQTVTQTYYLGGGCPGTSPLQKTRKATYNCTSVAETTKLSCKGNISGTLSRYNLLTSLWEEEPVKLDLSPNFYQGSNAEKAYNFVVAEGLSCECRTDSGPCPDVLPTLRAEILGDKEKVTKLEAGCTVVFPLDIDIVRRDQGDNLLSKNAGEGDCLDGGTIEKTLIQYPRTNASILYYSYAGSAILAGKGGTVLDPTSIIHSGPGLYANYSAGLAQYVGLKGSERLFKDTNCSSNEQETFRSPKGAPLQTGITASMEGTCPNGLNINSILPSGENITGSIVQYDGTDRGRAYYQYEDQQGCYGSYPGCCPPCEIYGKQGTYKLACENEKQCYRNDCSDERDPETCPLVPHPSGSGYESKCAIPFGMDFILGRYAQTQAEQTYYGIKYISGVRVPLDVAAKNSDEQDLCLSFMFVGGKQDGSFYAASYPQVNDLYASNGPPLPIGVPIVTTCKTWHESAHYYLDSGYTKEVIEVGTLTLKAGEWSTAVPLYTTHIYRTATECTGTDVKGISGHEGWIIACERVTAADCSDLCDCCSQPGVQGCGEMVNESPCNQAKPCEPLICTYSYSSSATVEDGCPQTAICGGCQQCESCDGDCDLCACCGCNCDCDPGPEGHENPCPPFIPTPPTTHSGGGEMGCYGDAIEDEVMKTAINITMEFIPFEETGGVKQL